MRKGPAAAGSAVFFALAPGVVAGLVPWLLTGWRPGRPLADLWPLRALGAALVVAGAAVLVHAFTRFVVEGLGTPAPVAPPANLVVGGLYRYVRNPMYLAVIAAIVGQALLLWRFALLWYALAAAIAVAAFVHWYEEPTLRRQFGRQYEEYRRAVPGWRPAA
jgi:protein-S-isoprenylcysteine O-methyltransferase Ste14